MRSLISVDHLKALHAPSFLGRLPLRQTPPIGIDFGAGSMKVLQVARVVGGENSAPSKASGSEVRTSSAGGPYSLVAAACIQTPEDLRRDVAGRLAFQIEALPRLLKAAGFKAKRAVCSIPAPSTICKHLRVPRPEGATVASVVKAAVPMQLGVDPSAIVFRHVEVCDAGGGKSEVICMAAARELVQRLMKAIHDSKLEPVGIHNEFTAILEACKGLCKGDEPALYLDLGAGSTKAVIAHGSSMVFAKSIDIGGFHLDDTVAKQRKVGAAEANAIRRGMESLTVSREARASDPVVAVATEDLSEPLEMLTDEISMCLRYHESLFGGRRVGRIVFVGGEARQTALCQHIARVLRLPAQVADPFACVARDGTEPCVGVDMSQAQPGWTVALGLCLGPTDL